MKDLLLGIDIGTTGTKCSFYRFDGTIEASAYQEYPMLHPQKNWSEQDPERWWRAVCENLRDCFGRQRIASERVAAVGVSGTNAVLLVDPNGIPLSNAIGLHDQRSDRQLQELKENVGEEIFLRRAGNRLAKGSFALPRLKWLQEECPEQIKESRCFLTPDGFLVNRLTGEFIINHSRANLTLLANIETGEWDDELVSASGFPRELLPTSIPTCTVAGTVSRKAAEETGLQEGTPVSAGAVDTVQATLAAGAYRAGDIAITIGSSGRVCTISDKPIYDSRLLNCESPIPGLYTIIQTTDNAGVSLKWFRDSFGESIRERAASRGISLYQQIDEEAEKVAPGAGGMIYLPYLNGEQSPIWDPSARGVFFGVNLESGFGSFARAVLEGVAFSIKDCLLLASKDLELPEVIPAGGGVANSDIWCQIFADVLGVAIAKVPQPETETLGDIITAAQSIGFKEPDFSLGKTMSVRSQIFEPRKCYREMYEDQFAKYKRIYEKLKAEF